MENFRGLIARAVLNDTTPSNFAEKTFMNSHKTAKLAKVSCYTVLRHTVNMQ